MKDNFLTAPIWTRYLSSQRCLHQLLQINQRGGIHVTILVARNQTRWNYHSSSHKERRNIKRPKTWERTRPETFFEVAILAFQLINLLLKDLDGFPESISTPLQLQDFSPKLATERGDIRKLDGKPLKRKKKKETGGTETSPSHSKDLGHRDPEQRRPPWTKQSEKKKRCGAGMQDLAFVLRGAED